ncbi:pyridoxal phosphate-dependent aminotransferase [Chloroflexota bacterium]
MPISDRVKKSMDAGSWIRRMFEEGIILRQQYGDENVYDLSLGNPLMEPPPEFLEEMKRLVDKPFSGMHRYMENAGYAATRDAVAEYLSKESGITFTRDDIIMTCGAAGALNIVLKTILNTEDEVIMFAPYFPEFINYIENHGGIAKVLPTDEQFIPRLDAIEAAIGPRTKAVLVNSPNNPSGAVYGEEFYKNVGELLERKSKELGHPIFLINDEAYRKLAYDGLECPQVWEYYRQSIVIASYSKDLAVPGERIGYVAAHPDLEQHNEMVAGFIHCNRILGFVNAPAIMQHLVRNLQGMTIAVAEYQKKRDFLYENLTDMGYSIFKPQGTFYLFPKSPLEDDIALVNELRQWRVLTVPGISFGSPGYFRISYCTEYRTLEGSLEGFRKVAEKFNLS